METMEKTEKKVKFILPNKKVLVTPVRRGGSWLPNNHEASFLFKNSYFSVVVPRTSRGELVDPLSDEEREYFESIDGKLALKPGDLSIHKTTKDKNGKELLKNYWTNFKVKLTKDVLELDLSKPIDYIRYKVLLSNKEIIAPSGAEKFKKGTYKFALVEQGWEDQELVKASRGKKEAYRAFGKMDNSPEKMKDFLSAYYITKPGGKTVPANAKDSFLIAEIEKIIEKDLTGFLDVYEDKDYDAKITISKALRTKALERDGQSYRTPEGITIGQNLREALIYITNPANSETVLKIQARIDNAK